MRVLLLAVPLLIVLAATREHGVPQPLPPDAMRVPLDQVPPDACLELFGPGPCRPHGATPTTGWTDAVAGQALAGWRGKVRQFALDDDPPLRCEVERVRAALRRVAAMDRSA